MSFTGDRTWNCGSEKRCRRSNHHWHTDWSWRSASRPVPIHWKVPVSRSQQFRNGAKLGGAWCGWKLARKATADRVSSDQLVEKLNQGIWEASWVKTKTKSDGWWLKQDFFLHFPTTRFPPARLILPLFICTDWLSGLGLGNQLGSTTDHL